MMIKTITSILFFFANSIASNDKVPQSTVKINFTFLFIKYLKLFIVGPYPSFFLSGI